MIQTASQVIILFQFVNKILLPETDDFLIFVCLYICLFVSAGMKFGDMKEKRRNKYSLRNFSKKTVVNILLLLQVLWVLRHFRKQLDITSLGWWSMRKKSKIMKSMASGTHCLDSKTSYITIWPYTRHSLCPFFLVLKNILKFSSVQFLSRVRIFVSPWTAACTALCPSPPPGVYSNSYPLSPWCFPTSSYSVGPSSSRLQSFPASGSFIIHQFFTSGSQSIGVSASASVHPMNVQDWFPLGWTGSISL